jgi:hypothetical protein
VQIISNVSLCRNAVVAMAGIKYHALWLQIGLFMPVTDKMRRKAAIKKQAFVIPAKPVTSSHIN